MLVLRMRKIQITMKVTKASIDQRIFDHFQNLIACHDLAKEPWYTVDLGNSHPHIGEFQKGELISVSPLSPEKGLSSFTKEMNWVSSNVTRINIDQSNRLDHLRTERAFIDMPVHYSKTLGEDRLYQSYFIHKLFPQERILLIDAGTFITIDLIDQDGFQGGFIFPGINAFLSSYNRGQKLPQLNKVLSSLEEDLPHNTEDAILEATKVYLKSILTYILAEYSSHTPVITGGTGKILSEVFSLENYYPHLIHQSLFSIAIHHHSNSK